MNGDLSELQLRILLQVAKGYSTNAILSKFCLPYSDFLAEVDKLKKELSARNLREAVVIAHDLGLIEF